MTHNQNLNFMWKSLLSLLLISCLVTTLYAQERQVSGKITGPDGAPVPYATVQIKGTTRGTTSDQNGNFKLQVDGADAILQVRSVGFATKEITVGSSGAVDVSLAQDNTALQEVVVTGLGIRREKKALGYAVQDVQGADLTRANQGDALRGLSGKVAGLQVSGSGGTPGSATFI
jgi:hypothetical protein